MKGSFQILRLFNIPVLIHWTFLLVFVWLGITSYVQSWDWASIIWTFSFLIALFGCVVLHEFGHALTARYYGVDTRDIILSPIGGIARLDRLPEKPFQEFMVAIAGPLVNIGICFTLAIPVVVSSADQGNRLLDFVALMANPGGNLFLGDLTAFQYFLFGLIAINLILAIFNLLPAFPMDGGRVLRSLLSMRIGRLKATRIATFIGQGIAIGLAVYGAINLSFITAFIGIFVFVSAAQEYKMVRFDGLLEKYAVRDVLRSDYSPLYLQDHLSAVVDLLKTGLEKHFIVLNEWQEVIGVLSEKQILDFAKEHPGDTKLEQLVKASYEPLILSDTLKEVFSKLQTKRQGIAPVYDRGQLVGVIDWPSVNHFLSVQQKLKA
jgi:Zn-dependent protease/predicted transcriptional regulator